MMKQVAKNNEHVLCVRPDGMGDVLMTSPAFRALKETFPGMKLTLLTSPSGGAIAQFIPEIDEIITVKVPWEKMDTTPTESKELLDLIQSLQQKKFDRAIIFTTFSQNASLSALLCYLAEIPKRLAYSPRKPYALLTDWIQDKEPTETIRHEVKRQLELVKYIGATTTNKKLSLQIPLSAKKSLEKILVQKNISLSKPIILLHPGASSVKRQYSTSGFAQIALQLHDLGYQVICTGNENEKALVNRIISESNNTIVSLAGVLSLAELIVLISFSSLLISNNTGPVHIAAALQTPIIDLYALTNPQHTPWQVPSTVLYFQVAKSLQHEVVENSIPPNALPLRNPLQVVAEAIRLLEQIHRHSYL